MPKQAAVELVINHNTGISCTTTHTSF